MSFLSLLSPFLTGLLQPLKDYVSYKTAEVAANRDLRLAQIAADKEAIVAQAQADSSDLTSRLNATTREFKQNTFWLLCAPVAFSILFPSKAEVMWANFGLMPEWFQWLFISVYSSIWGLPIVKGGYGSITELLKGKREYNICKIKTLNEAALAAALRKTIYKNGMTQAQWDAQLDAYNKSMQDSQP